MYNGELEVQAKRKTLAVLHDEINHILNAARDLSSLTDSIIKGTSKENELSLVRMKNAGEEVENLRRKMTREISDTGSLMVYREDVLRTAYIIDEIARALSINPSSTIELAHEVQNIERKVDNSYRKVVIKALNEIPNTKDLLLVKDAVEGIEGMADKCQAASDSLTILALS